MKVCVCVCLVMVYSQMSSIVRNVFDACHILPQMKMIIALVVVALLLIIIGNCQTKLTHTG